MTKEQFRALRNKGYSIEFVERGEDITASVIPPPAMGDAVIMIGPGSCIGKKINKSPLHAVRRDCHAHAIS